MGDVKGTSQTRWERAGGVGSVRSFSILVHCPRNRFDKQANLNVVAAACRSDDLTNDLYYALDE